MCGGEGLESLGDSFDQTAQGVLRGTTQRGFEFGKSHFDGVEIRAVGGQIEQTSPPFFHDFLDAADFVTGKIVADHQIARLEFRPEDFLQVGQEQRAIHRPIDDPRSAEPIMAERGDESGGRPMAVRSLPQTALAACRASVEARHFGVEPGLIQKDQPADVPRGRVLAPLLPCDDQIRTLLFGGAQRFF